MLASHSLDADPHALRRVAWLHRGALRALGDVESVLEEYERESLKRTYARTPAAGRVRTRTG